MKNREIYPKDPSTRKLVNEGVASVNDDQTEEALAVLRYELETFVCDGQYAKALEHILENLPEEHPPGAASGGLDRRLLRLGQVPPGQDAACPVD